VTEATVWGGIALASLLTLAVFVVQYARALLPLANALKVIHAVDALVDDRIARTFERVRARRERTPGAQPSSVPPGVPERANPLAEVFGPGPLFLPDQPDADDERLEVVQA
jgi:hypothetical protein